MNVRTDTFKPLSAALASGTTENVLACLDPDGTVVIQRGNQVTSLTGADLQAEVQGFLSAFESLSLTPVSRSVSGASITEEAVVAGNHVGAWAGMEPSHRRVRFSVRLIAEPTEAQTLHLLWLEPDTPALLAQIAETEDLFGVTAGLIARVHERETRPVRVTGDGQEQAVTEVDRPRRARVQRQDRSQRRRTVIVTAVLVALLSVVATAAWRLALPSGNAPLGPAGAAAAKTLNKAKTAPKPPLVKKIPVRTVPARQPVITTAAPKAVPKVQAGRQVVLSSDVLFGAASSVVAPGARSALARVAQDVRRGKVRGTIQVNGYTDNTGDAGKNLALSRARALAVARVLQPALSGLAVVLAPQGFGESGPIAANSTGAGQARNRRVTIVLPRK